jgi:putative toxin-antitoxin system antitoxin component (TIGR02293 family)
MVPKWAIMSAHIGRGAIMRQGAEQRQPQSAWQPAVERLVAGGSYEVMETLSRLDRIDIVKEGLPARILATLANDMRVPRERLYGWIGIARTTANRKVTRRERLSQDESERALGIARLVGEVQTIVAESGEPQGFDAARWTASWLEEANDALGGRAPGEFMDTADGRSLVSGLVAQMQSGAYA